MGKYFIIKYLHEHENERIEIIIIDQFGNFSNKFCKEAKESNNLSDNLIVIIHQHLMMSPAQLNLNNDQIAAK